jgi:hypothetical protein
MGNTEMEITGMEIMGTALRMSTVTWLYIYYWIWLYCF